MGCRGHVAGRFDRDQGRARAQRVSAKAQPILDGRRQIVGVRQHLIDERRIKT